MSLRPAALAATVLTASLALAACGSSSDSGTSSSASATGGSSSSQGDSFPVTIKHAFGETTIAKKPERIATLGWGNHEVPLALGIVPVGMSKAVWGDDDKDGVLPWVSDKIKALGGSTPRLFDDSTAIDYEAVADTKPDVILAAYSGLTKEQYDKLSKIAPVVAYPKTAWTTSLHEMIEMDSKAIGKESEGKALEKSLDDKVTTIAAKHPALKGKAALFTFVDPKDLSKITYYNALDPRMALLRQVGMTTPAIADPSKATSFFSTISAEQGDKLSDVDMMVTYSADGAGTLKTARSNPLWARLAPVKNGAVAFLADDTPLAAAANPSPLNIDWGLDKYLTVLDGAAAKAK